MEQHVPHLLRINRNEQQKWKSTARPTATKRSEDEVLEDSRQSNYFLLTEALLSPPRSSVPPGSPPSPPWHPFQKFSPAET